MKQLLAFTLFLLLFRVSFSQVPFNTSPIWVSTAASYYSTGCGWADINKDGWQDLVISNGNDMSRKNLVVYLNNNGTLPLTPSWSSSDIDYHGHLSIGDVNKDGYPDVAVSVYIGASGFNSKGRVKLYINNNGTLSSLPVWYSGDSLYTFSCAFGDADNDGDLDLAVAAGESYNNIPEYLRIYYNNGGTLSSFPQWKSITKLYGMDVAWNDFNGDGLLDLVFACEIGPARMFLNYGDSIGTSPYWSSGDASIYSNSLFTGDVNNDGKPDLAVADNNQLGGTGKFKIYLNTGTTLNAIPYWSSAFSGYGSGINLCDIDNDNDLDLITGGWWRPCYIYLNNNGNYNINPDWTSSTSSVVEAITFTDFDKDGIDTLHFSFTGNGIKKLFFLPRKPVEKILFIKIGSDTLSVNQYCYDLENGWIVLSQAPLIGTNVQVKYISSKKPDFAVSNWDVGNYVFKNNLVVGIDKTELVNLKNFVLYQNFPNPFNMFTKINYSLNKGNFVQIKFFNSLGQEISEPVNEYKESGNYSYRFDGNHLSTGAYFYSISVGGITETKTMLLLK